MRSEPPRETPAGQAPAAPPSPPAVAALAVVLIAFLWTIGGVAEAKVRLYVATWDLAIANQSAWLLTHRAGLYLTTRGLGVFEHHLHFLLLLLAPLYRLAASPLTLVWVQTVAVAAAAVPIFALARRKTGSDWVGVAWAALFLANPAVQRMTLHDVHLPTLATPFLTAALYYADGRRWRACAVCCGLTLLAQEDAGLAVAGLGLALCLLGARRAGVGVLVAGLVYAFVGMKLLIPLFSKHLGETYVTGSYYGHLGGSMTEVALAPVLRPLVVLKCLARPDNARLLRDLLVPYALLCLLKPQWLVGALPVLYLNMVSEYWPARTIGYHYTAYLNPYLIVAAVAGGAWLTERLQAKGVRRPVALACPPVLALLALVLLPAAWPGSAPDMVVTPLNREATIALWHRDRPWAAAVDQVIAGIPPGASVSAQMHLLPKVSGRRQAWWFPEPFYRGNQAADPATVAAGVTAGLAREPVEFVLVRVRPGVPAPLTAEGYAAAVVALDRSPAYERWRDLGEVRVYRRRALTR